MKKIVFLFLAIFIIPNVFSIEIGSVVQRAQEFGQQYENGQLNYLQLKVNTNLLREEIYEEFFGENFRFEESDEQDLEIYELFEQGKNAYFNRDEQGLISVLNQLEVEFNERGEEEAIKILNGMRKAIDERDSQKFEELARKLEDFFRRKERHEEFEGWSKEKVEALLGPPTFFEDRVWVENLQRDVRVEEKIPAWEKSVFDGSNIKISINAWPHLTEYQNEIVAFYWVDIETRFKKQLDVPNVQGLINDLEQRISSFYETGVGEQELAELIVQNERSLNEILEQNKSQCQETMLDFFGSTYGTSSRIEWTGLLFEGQQGAVFLKLEETLDEEWHDFWIWFEIDARIEEFEFGEEFEDFEFHEESFDFERLFNQNTEQTIREFKELISTIKNTVNFGNFVYYV